MVFNTLDFFNFLPKLFYILFFILLMVSNMMLGGQLKMILCDFPQLDPDPAAQNRCETLTSTMPM